MESKSEFLTVAETAELLKVDTETVYRQLNAGKLPGAKIGGSWRVRRSDLDKMFETNTKGA